MVKSVAAEIAAALFFLTTTAQADEDLIIRQVSADACDARLAEDDVQTAENRALDKASLAAIKTSGLIQGYYPKLSDMALNLVAYRIIDEYLFDIKHNVTLDDAKQICVHIDASLEMAPEDLHVLVAEYKSSVPVNETEIMQIVQEVQQETEFKPQNLNEKKLVFITPLRFWNGAQTNSYRNLLQESLAGGDYFYITDEETMADFTVEPYVETAHIEHVDAQNRKMQVSLTLNIRATNNQYFEPITEQQNHFILFAEAKDEQQVANTLIQKLLERAGAAAKIQLNHRLADNLEKQKIRGQ